MSLMDFFRPAAQQNPAANQQPAQTTNGQQQQQPNPAMDATKQEPDPAAAPDPMKAFEKLWEVKKPEEGAEPEFNPSAIFNTDPEGMQKAVAGINFADMVTEDSLAAIQAGGPEALKAMVSMLNGTASKVMTMATTASAKMIEQGLTKASGALDGKINKQVKLNQVNSHMQELNPALSSPAAAPMVKALTTQFTNQYPLSSATEISAMVKDYMVGFADLAAGKKEPVQDPATAGQPDWETYFSGGQQG